VRVAAHSVAPDDHPLGIGPFGDRVGAAGGVQLNRRGAVRVLKKAMTTRCVDVRSNEIALCGTAERTRP